MKRDTLISLLLQHVRDNPGVTGSQIHFRFQLIGTKHAISSTLGRLQTQGLIENRGNHGRWSYWYPTAIDTPEPEFLNRANLLLEEMKKLPKFERATFLALFLQNYDLEKRSDA